MRTSLIVALLVAPAALAGALIGNNIIAAAPTDRSATAVDKPLSPSTSSQQLAREPLSAAEQDIAVRRGLLPQGTKSLLTTVGPMRHGDFKWNEDGVPAGKVTIWVDLRTQLISVFRGGHEIGTAVVVYGAESMESPTGHFPILTKSRDYHSRAYDAPMPYSMFITNTGVALHGSPMSSRRATHGCVGLPVEFARLLFAAANIGDEVRIVRSEANASAARQSAAKS